MKRLLGILGVAPFLLALSVGTPAPDFSAKDQDGKMIRLSEFKGKFVLLYFYPKDDTPGCTQEACNFRDHSSQFRKVNTVVFGVSRQDEKSHRKFRSKHRLSFDLLVDADGSLAQSFDIGSIPLLGITRRQSILIDPQGNILKVYKEVEPATHSQQVLGDIKHELNLKK